MTQEALQWNTHYFSEWFCFFCCRKVQIRFKGSLQKINLAHKNSKKLKTLFNLIQVFFRYKFSLYMFCKLKILICCCNELKVHYWHIKNDLTEKMTESCISFILQRQTNSSLSSHSNHQKSPPPSPALHYFGLSTAEVLEISISQAKDNRGKYKFFCGALSIRN